MGETLDFFRGRLDSMIDLRHPRTPQRQRTILGPLIRELRGKLAVGTLNIGASSFTLSLSSLSSLSTLL